MWRLTVIDDGEEAKYLEIMNDENAKNIQGALVENGCCVKKEKV